MATQQRNPQELDDILDDALDAFDPEPNPPSTAVAPPLYDDVEEAPPLPASATTMQHPSPPNATSSAPPRVLNAVRDATNGSHPASVAADATNAPPSSETSREETVGPPPGIDDGDDPGKALEDALRALSELAVNSSPQNDIGNSSVDGGQMRGADTLGGVDGLTADADMKLVEDFVTSLGESLSSLGAADVLGAAGANGVAQQERQRQQSAGTGGAPKVSPLSPQKQQQQQSGEGGPSTPVVERLVESIVSQLLSEDVLKAPMMQMREAYAQWLPRHEGTLSDVDRKRFRKQRELVEDICKRYEGGSSSTDDIMTLLSQMQELGPPPDEVMNHLSMDDGQMDAFIERFAGGIDAAK